MGSSVCVARSVFTISVHAFLNSSHQSYIRLQSLHNNNCSSSLLLVTRAFTCVQIGVYFSIFACAIKVC